MTNNWRWSLILILVLLLYSFYDRYPDQRTFINSDGHGYYGYLPAVFIYQDLKFNFIDDLRNNHVNHFELVDDYRRSVDGGIVNITYVGVAICQLPFFLIGHTVALLTGFDANGYSTPYQLAVLLGAFFYLLAGLWAFGRLLDSLRIKPWLISFCLIILVFATSTIYYVIDQPAMSHIYSLAMFCIFLLYTRRFLFTHKTRYIWYMAASLALIGIIRPTNVIMILAVPVVAGSWKRIIDALQWVVRNPGKVIFPILMLFAILFIQPLLYFIQTGNFLVWSYQAGATFNFLDPEIYNILFSYEAGLFVYTPILLTGVIGLLVYFRHNKFVVLWLIVAIAVPVYVLASWWNWWFGMSYGNRAFIEFYPLFFLGAALGFNTIRKSIIVHFFIFISLVFIVFNLIQLYQYRTYAYYWYMDRDMYWRVFLRTTPAWHGYFWEEEKFTQSVNSLHNNFPNREFHVNINFENLQDQEGVMLVTGLAHTGLFSAYVGKEEMYKTVYTKTISHELEGKRGILSQVFMHPESDPTKTQVYFLVEVYRNETSVLRLEPKTRYYNQFSRQWNRINVLNIEGFDFKENDTLIVYFYNPFGNSFRWDDFTLDLYAGKN